MQPIASPEPHEKARHYLWRFWNRLPKSGHVTVFDRTWYGRVMVERLEGFCSENDWQRAYVEINEFEKELSDWGAVIVKFWVQIDKDTQLARFKSVRIHRKNAGKLQMKTGVTGKNGICTRTLLMRCLQRPIQHMHRGIFWNLMIKNMQE